MNVKILTIFALVIVSCFSPAISFGDGLTILKSLCTKCHNIESGPKNMTEAVGRMAPDLYYSGVKYNDGWLRQWLVKPKRLRPAGYRFFENFISGTDEDLLVKENIKSHISLSKSDAEAVEKTLMSFKAKSNLIIKNKYVPKPVNLSEGEMYFDKLSGCLACHSIEPNFGGLSGPEIYTVGKRLKTDFVYSYIKNPQGFDKYTTMPNKELSEKVLQILTNYMVNLEEQK